MAVKGTKNVRRIRTRSQTDVWQIPRIPGNQTIHPTEKPIEMMKRIIETVVKKGNMLLISLQEAEWYRMLPKPCIVAGMPSN
ncbi:hypothetical protein AMQ83_02790 [Paenibacillus riograndensis]|nr:hypothetical protein AMQ83_02790 [Paenibacillus riograndensis]